MSRTRSRSLPHARALPRLASSAVALVALVGCQPGDVLDAWAADDVVVLETPESVPESDANPTVDVGVRERDGSVTQLGKARAVTRHPRGGVLVVDEKKRLALVKRDRRVTLLDEVEGKPAVLRDGSVVVARATDPGESDLWVATIDGQPPRPLTKAPGADGHPFVLEDGRVWFLSSRTGVTSVFVLDPATGETTQLTNQGQQPGQLSDDFVPPPALGEPWQEGRRVFYDAGDAVWSVDVVTGEAEVVR